VVFLLCGMMLFSMEICFSRTISQFQSTSHASSQRILGFLLLFMDLVRLNKKLYLLIGLPTLICQMILTGLFWGTLIS
jgi:hypothetical protein